MVLLVIGSCVLNLYVGSCDSTLFFWTVEVSSRRCPYVLLYLVIVLDVYVYLSLDLFVWLVELCGSCLTDGFVKVNWYM
ncbi:hypothetical protein Hanom_Chr11g01050371 [Helianthus anomalus]